MTHSFIAFNVSRTQMFSRAVDSFAHVEPGYESPEWITGLCRAGDEWELIHSMLWHLDNPEPEQYEDDFEPEYTMRGGWAALN